MRLMRFLFVALFSVGLFAQAAVAATPTDTQQKAESDRVAMSHLAQAAMSQAMRVMYKRQKPIYPFALLQYKDGRVDSITYKPQKNADGSLKPQPDADKWAAMLFMKLKHMAATQPKLEIALLTRMDKVDTKNGKQLLGIWTEVDHRDARPWVVFLPLIKQKDGSRKKGELIYYATNQPIFAHDIADTTK